MNPITKPDANLPAEPAPAADATPAKAQAETAEVTANRTSAKPAAAGDTDQAKGKPVAQKAARQRAAQAKATPKVSAAAKPAAKPVAKAGTKSAPKTPAAVDLAAPVAAAKQAPKQPTQAKPEAKATRGAAAKPPKTAASRDKLVRDSFTMPRADYALIQALKDRAMGFRRPTKKSELLRAGLQAMNALNDRQLQALLSAMPELKAGRPSKGR